jgi:hypothetical protein
MSMRLSEDRSFRSQCGSAEMYPWKSVGGRMVGRVWIVMSVPRNAKMVVEPAKSSTGTASGGRERVVIRGEAE